MQEQSGTAFSGSAPPTAVREYWGQEAVQDKKLYDYVRGAAAALTEAARRIAGKPKPEPERRPRRLSAVLILAGVATLVRAMHRQQQGAASGAVRPAAAS